MECFEQKRRSYGMELSGIEQVLANGVYDGIITKIQYRNVLVTLEKKYGRMLSRSDIGKKRK